MLNPKWFLGKEVNTEQNASSVKIVLQFIWNVIVEIFELLWSVIKIIFEVIGYILERLWDFIAAIGEAIGEVIGDGDFDDFGGDD